MDTGKAVPMPALLGAWPRAASCVLVAVLAGVACLAAAPAASAAQQEVTRYHKVALLKSFGGWPSGFCDGVHPGPAMMKSIVRTVV